MDGFDLSASHQDVAAAAAVQCSDIEADWGAMEKRLLNALK